MQRHASWAAGPGFYIPRLWRWGPRNYTGTIVIVLGSDDEGDREHFKTVDSVGRTYHPYSRRDEHFEIFLCRDLDQNLHTLWPSIKKWH